MDAIDFYLEKLSSLEPKMKALQFSQSAKLRYHLMADAVYWTDEIPRDLEPEQEDALRILLRHRMTLILGSSKDKWIAFWETGKRLFPEWIGFCRARVSPDPKVIKFYSRKSESFRRQLRKAKAQGDITD